MGDYGRNGDGAVFRNSSIGRNLRAGTLNIPQPHPLSKEPQKPAFPYYFVGDAACPLSKHLLKPYPSRNLTNSKRIFNYRLSRARRSVECAFGLMVSKYSKFKVLERPILSSPNKTDKIVKAICILHNFIRKMDGIRIYQNQCFSQTKSIIITPQNNIIFGLKVSEPRMRR